MLIAGAIFIYFYYRIEHFLLHLVFVAELIHYFKYTQCESSIDCDFERLLACEYFYIISITEIDPIFVI